MSKRDSKELSLAPTKSRELKPTTSRELKATSSRTSGDPLSRTKSHEMMDAARKQHGNTHKVPRDSTWKGWFAQRKEALEAFEEETKAAISKAKVKH